MVAELHRLRGRLRVRLSRLIEAEADFLRAGEVARQQGAMLFELRAVSELAQLWADQGHAEKASNLLTPVFDAFPKGLDTPDIEQARRLLERCSQQ